MFVSGPINLHEHCSQQCGDNSNCGDKKRIHDASPAVNGNADRHGRDDRVDVGFKKVRSHSCNVADVVADVIRDDGGVSRIVLRNAGLDFSDQIRADVRGFRIDAAADTRKEGDGAGSHAEACDDVRITEQNVTQSDSQNADADNGHSHDASAAESNAKSLIDAQRSGK